MENKHLLTDDQLQELSSKSPDEVNEDLFLHYTALCDAMSAAYAIFRHFAEEFKNKIPAPEDVES